MKNLNISAKNHEITMSQIVLGSSDYLKLDNMDKVNTMFDTYVALGGNTFDTARHYRESEAVIGQWLNRHDRHQFNIITKACHPVREARNTPRVTPENIRVDITESLKQLQTDYVDVLLLHRDDPTYPVGPLMEELSKLVDEEKIHFFGVSNWTLPRLKEAIAYCTAHNLHPLSFNSPNFSLATVNQPRWANSVTADYEMIDWHTQQDFPLISWSAQAEGFFARRYGLNAQNSNDSDIKEFADVYFNDTNWSRLGAVEQLAKEHGVKPIQIALAYVLNASFPAFATIGPEEEWQLRESIAAANITLTTDEMMHLKKGAITE